MLDDDRTLDPDLDGAMFDLRGAVTPFVRSAGTEAVRSTVRRRRTVRRAVTGVLAVAVVATLSTTAIARTTHNAGVDPASRNLGQVDWSRARLVVPPIGSCPGGEVTFKDGRAARSDTDSPSWAIIADDRRGLNQPVSGELDGKAGTDALVRIDCTRSGVSSAAVVAYALRPNGPELMSLVTQANSGAGEWPESAIVHDLTVTVQIRAESSGGSERVVREQAVRWERLRFGPVPITALLGRQEPDHLAEAITNIPAMPGCPASARPLADTKDATTRWTADLPGTDGVGDVTGDEADEVLVKVVCVRDGVRTGMVIAVLTVDAQGRAVTLGTFGAQAYAEVEALYPKGGDAIVAVVAAAGQPNYKTFHWNGRAFVEVA